MAMRVRPEVKERHGLDGVDEKLLIHDYAPNGSLANISFSRSGRRRRAGRERRGAEERIRESGVGRSRIHGLKEKGPISKYGWLVALLTWIFASATIWRPRKQKW